MRPSIWGWASEVGDYGLEEESDILWIQAYKDRPGLEYEIDGIDIAIT